MPPEYTTEAYTPVNVTSPFNVNIWSAFTAKLAFLTRDHRIRVSCFSIISTSEIYESIQKEFCL